MKLVLTTCAAILFLITPLFAQAPGAKIEFKGERDIHLGVYKQGEIAKHTFEFTNTGSQDLVIYEVRTTCSCTASDWPKDAIKPGETGQIKVEFDSHNKLGSHAKGINVFSNAGESNLIIEVEVTK